MQRIGNLWPQVASFANLYEAARKAQRGKRQRENVLAFNYRLEDELLSPGVRGESSAGSDEASDCLRKQKRPRGLVGRKPKTHAA